MSQRWTHDELAHVVGLRHRTGLSEGNGANAFVEFKMKITPELLDKILGGTWRNADGSTVRLDGIIVDDDGYVEPIMTRIEAKT